MRTLGLLPGSARPIDQLGRGGGGLFAKKVGSSASSGPAPIALVASVAVSPAGHNGGTSAAIDTTGASLLVICVGFYIASGIAGVSDSKGNTYTPLTIYTAASTTVERLYYCANPIVGAGHTFTVLAGGGLAYQSIVVGAFSGTDTAAAANGDVGAANVSASSLQPGSLTPSTNNSIVVTGLAFYDAPGLAVATINSGFTIIAQINGNGNLASALAYKVQTTAIAVNPLWTVSGAAVDIAVSQTSFKHS